GAVTNVKGQFNDGTEAAGIRSDGLYLGLTFIDYDHDGDLDLFVTRTTGFATSKLPSARTPPAPLRYSNLMLRNNGNGTFTDVTESIGLAGDTRSIAALGTAYNNDRPIDGVGTGGTTPILQKP